MIRYGLISSIAQFRRGRSLFLLTVGGVALGVASILTIQIINQNAIGAFQGSVKAISGASDLTVMAVAGNLDETIIAEVLAVRGVRRAWPIHTVEVSLADDREQFLRVVATDLSALAGLPWDGPPPRFSEALSTPGWAAFSPSVLDRLGLSMGDRLLVSAGSRSAYLQVGAVVDFRKLNPLATSRFVLMDLAQAQGSISPPGEVEQVEIELEDDRSSDEVRAALQARLGCGVRITTTDERTGEARTLLGAFRLNLTVFSLISIFVGAFLIYSSTQATLVRRRRELGVLRTLGATRRQVTGLLLAEVILLGLLGVGVGIGIGYLAAKSMMAEVSATLSNIYLLEEIERIRIPARHFLLAIAVGVGGAVMGAIGPSWEISRRPPRSLLAAYPLHERIGGAAPRLFMAGIAVLPITFVLWSSSLRDWKPGGFLLGIAILIAVPLITPQLIRWFFGAIAVRSFGFRFGLVSIGQTLQATALPAAALALAVSMLVGITLMVGSFRQTVAIWVDSTAQADVYLSGESWRRARSDAPIPEDLVRAISSRKGVAGVERFRQFFGYTGSRKIAVIGTEFHLPGREERIALWRGDPLESMRRVRQEGAVYLSEPLSRKEGLSIGDDIILSCPSGPVSLPVAGLYYDYTSEGGAVVMDLSTMNRLFGAGPVHSLALYLNPGVDPDQFIHELGRDFEEHTLHVRNNALLRKEIFDIFDQTFAVTGILQIMALLVAACGVTLSLIVIARERINELALYRSLGSTRWQIFRVFLGKGAGIALVGIILGTVAGLGLAMVLIYVINLAWFGWTIAFHWPWSRLLTQIPLVLLVALLASLYPALRASRTPAGELSREDV